MCGVNFVLHFHFTPYLDVRGTTGIVLYWPRRFLLSNRAVHMIALPRMIDGRVIKTLEKEGRNMLCIKGR